MKHVAIYCRVSSRQQDVASQEPELKRWADAQAEQVVWYCDKFTGKTMDRPGWNRLVDDLKAGKLTKIVCWRIDRLGRTASGLTGLFEDLTSRKVNLISLRDGIDLQTAAGRLLANMLASVAAFETEVRAERVRAGQAAARAKGATWGGSKKGWRWKVNDHQASAVFEMKASGKKISHIARATGLSRPTIYRLLAS